MPLQRTMPITGNIPAIDPAGSLLAGAQTAGALRQEQTSARAAQEVPGLLERYRAGEEGALMQIAQLDPKMAENIVNIEQAKQQGALGSAQIKAIQRQTAAAEQAQEQAQMQREIKALGGLKDALAGVESPQQKTKIKNLYIQRAKKMGIDSHPLLEGDWTPDMDQDINDMFAIGSQMIIEEGKPLSPEGKFAADVKAGFLPKGAVKKKDPPADMKYIDGTNVLEPIPGSETDVKRKAYVTNLETGLASVKMLRERLVDDPTLGGLVGSARSVGETIAGTLESLPGGRQAVGAVKGLGGIVGLGTDDALVSELDPVINDLTYSLAKLRKGEGKLNKDDTDNARKDADPKGFTSSPEVIKKYDTLIKQFEEKIKAAGGKVEESPQKKFDDALGSKIISHEEYFKK